MTSPALPPLPDCDIPSWLIDGAEDFCDYFKEETLIAYGQQCRDEALEAACAAINTAEREGDYELSTPECLAIIRALKTTPLQGEPR